MKRRFRTRNAWQVYRWPLILAFVSVIGLAAALIGNGWLDLLSWLALGATLVVVIWAWFGQSSM